MTRRDIRSDGGRESALPHEAISTRVTNVFIPVQDVVRAREWYRDVLGLRVGDVVAGHLCVVAMPEGPDLLLDQKLRPDGPVTSASRGEYPLFMFATGDVEATLAELRERGVAVVDYDGRVIQDGHWFNFRDCDDNLLMMCA